MNPEQYWIGLGSEPIGLDVLADGEHARQADTYRTIARLVCDWNCHAVLDVGANYGILQDWLERAGYDGEYQGIDSNPYAVAKANQLGHRVEVGNIRTLDTPPAYDVVVVKDVIEHLENYQPLRNVFKAAKEFVILSVYLPFHDAPDSIQRNPDGYYTNTYNGYGVMDLARECGFALIETFSTHEANGTMNAIYLWGDNRAS